LNNYLIKSNGLFKTVHVSFPLFLVEFLPDKRYWKEFQPKIRQIGKEGAATTPIKGFMKQEKH